MRSYQTLPIGHGVVEFFGVTLGIRFDGSQPQRRLALRYRIKQERHGLAVNRAIERKLHLRHTRKIVVIDLLLSNDATLFVRTLVDQDRTSIGKMHDGCREIG